MLRTISLLIMRPSRPDETREVSADGYRALRPTLVELLDDGQPEHVAVLHEGKRADMFVDEESAGRLPRNDAATAIYRNNWLTQHPSDDPESLPAIYGPAILTSERVWF